MSINVLSGIESQTQHLCGDGNTDDKFPLAGPISAEFF
jgi:hypothetical protein